MAMDTPATVAVIGAGPIGLETALYARYLGYDVDVYESGEVAEHVGRWGHVQMFSPFSMNRSALGLAALRAQDPDFVPPGDDERLTGNQWRSRYLLPLSRSDLLIDSLQLGARVLTVEREGLSKDDPADHPGRAEAPFRILVEDPTGRRSAAADIVIDTSGVYGSPNPLGAGIAADGESELRDRIEYGLPDVLNSHRGRYAGRHTLLVGGGASAATTALRIAELGRQEPNTRLTWLARTDRRITPGSVPAAAEDPLSARAELLLAARRLAGDPPATITYRAPVRIKEIRWSDGRFRVRLDQEPEGWLDADEIVANVGYRPDPRLHDQLHLPLCPTTEAPATLAGRLREIRSDGSVSAFACQSSDLLNPEPHFYVLGAKSFGRDSSFLVRDGLEQIRRLFQLIGDRRELDLYRSMTNLLS